MNERERERDISFRTMLAPRKSLKICYVWKSEWGGQMITAPLAALNERERHFFEGERTIMRLHS